MGENQVLPLFQEDKFRQRHLVFFLSNFYKKRRFILALEVTLKLQKIFFFSFHGLSWYQIDHLYVPVPKLYWKLLYHVCRPRYWQKVSKNGNFCQSFLFWHFFAFFSISRYHTATFDTQF